MVRPYAILYERKEVAHAVERPVKTHFRIDLREEVSHAEPVILKVLKPPELGGTRVTREKDKRAIV